MRLSHDFEEQAVGRKNAERGEKGIVNDGTVPTRGTEKCGKVTYGMLEMIKS